MEKTTQEVKEKTIPYNLRERLETNYMDLEVPDDDNYLCKISSFHISLVKFGYYKQSGGILGKYLPTLLTMFS